MLLPQRERSDRPHTSKRSELNMAENKAEKFVFYMYKMTKSYPPNKEVLKDIS